MTIDKAIEYLIRIDRQYQTEEDKNYYLVHGLTDILKDIENDDIKILKDKIWKLFSKQRIKYSSFLDYLVNSNKDIALTYNKENDFKQEENNEEIHNILEFYDKYDENLIRYIKGHLFLEYIMNVILEKIINTNINQYTFNQKICLLYNNRIINKNEKYLLTLINKLRNKIAHILDFKFSFDEIFDIVKLSSECGVDYSDHTIYKNKKLSEEWYGVEGIITELFPNLFCHLLYKNEKYFNDTEIDKYTA